jgi:hypothetical protein
MPATIVSRPAWLPGTLTTTRPRAVAPRIQERDERGQAAAAAQAPAGFVVPARWASVQVAHVATVRGPRRA